MFNSRSGFYSNMFLGDRQTFLPMQLRAQGKEDKHYDLCAASAKVEEFTVHLKVARTITMSKYIPPNRIFGISHPDNKYLREKKKKREMAKYCVNVTE